MIKSIFFVGIGGAIGSVMRYILGSIGAHYFKGTFPFATFITNFLGCLIIGLLIGYFGKSNDINHPLKLLLIKELSILFMWIDAMRIIHNYMSSHVFRFISS